MDADTSPLGNINVKLRLELGDPALFWDSSPNGNEGNTEDVLALVGYKGEPSDRERGGLNTHAKLGTVGRKLAEIDFCEGGIDPLHDGKPTQALTVEVSRRVPRTQSHLTLANATKLPTWLETFNEDGIWTGLQTLRVRGDLEKTMLGNFLRRPRSSGLRAIQTNGGNGRTRIIPDEVLQVVVEALEHYNTSLMVFCEVLDLPAENKTRPRTNSHGTTCTCWKDVYLEQSRVQIVGRLSKVLERNKKLHDRFRRAISSVLVQARVVLYARAKPVPIWLWNWRWSAGLFDETKQWEAEIINDEGEHKGATNKGAPTSSGPATSLLAELPAELLERILKLAVTDADALTDEQWCRLLDGVRDRHGFRRLSLATASLEGAEFAATMGDWLQHGKMWWDQGVPHSEEGQDRR